LARRGLEPALVSLPSGAFLTDCMRATTFLLVLKSLFLLVCAYQASQTKDHDMNKTKYLHTYVLFCSLLVGVQALPGFARPHSDSKVANSQQTRNLRDGQHDFDFEIGTWKTRLKRLLHPLTGSTTWVEYEGTTVVRKVWDGRANLVELKAAGPAGHFEGLNLRLYNPESHQWSLNFANSASGSLSQPTVGEFKNGRGEFFDQETLNGRAIFVRFVISDITQNSCRFEQSFSDDGGKTWEVNWIATDTRVKE
jgi:hypothetical protein